MYAGSASRPWWLAIAAALSAACDPILNVQGSFFPAWLVCMAVGLVVAAICRQLFAALRLEPHVGPLLLIYPSLWVLLTLLTWLAFYRT